MSRKEKKVGSGPATPIAKQGKDEMDGGASESNEEGGRDVMGKVLNKMKKGETRKQGADESGTKDRSIATPLQSPGLKQKSKRTTGKGAPQEVYEDAIGKIQPTADTLAGNKPKFQSYEQPNGFQTQLDSVYQWNIVDMIYDSNHKEVDTDLKGMKDYIYPQANSIYYNRKVELVNLVEEKRKQDKKRLEFVLERSRLQEDTKKQMEKTTDRLRRLMEKYDIKHPLRGQQYQDVPTLKQEYCQKILSILSAPNSYLKYKKDQRETLDFSLIRSEEYVAQQQNLNFQQRTIMKYRLYGKDALTDHEWKKIIQWGVAEKVCNDYGQPIVKRVRVKKKVFKKRANPKTGEVHEVESEMSGDRESCYTHEDRFEFVDNEEGSPLEVNAGFEIKGLDPELFGEKAAKESLKKLNLRRKRARLRAL